MTLVGQGSPDKELIAAVRSWFSTGDLSKVVQKGLLTDWEDLYQTTNDNYETFMSKLDQPTLHVIPDPDLSTIESANQYIFFANGIEIQSTIKEARGFVHYSDPEMFEVLTRSLRMVFNGK
jgi:hypothetical protein